MKLEKRKREKDHLVNGVSLKYFHSEYPGMRAIQTFLKCFDNFVAALFHFHLRDQPTRVLLLQSNRVQNSGVNFYIFNTII